MKTITALDIAASGKIPAGLHPLLRVNSRKAWVEIVSKMIKNDTIKPTAVNVKKLLQNWEPILITHYSALN
jgi:hypothetical protein